MYEGNHIITCCCPLNVTTCLCPHEIYNNTTNNNLMKNQNNNVNTHKEQNNYLLKLFEKDKIIMNHLKTIEEQTKKIENLSHDLSTKDTQLTKLDTTINELKKIIDNLKKENNFINEEVKKYKIKIENDICQNQESQNIYTSKLNELNNKNLETNLKMNELISINQQLKDDNNILQNQILSKKNFEDQNMKQEINNLQNKINSQNEIIENKNIIIDKLKKENNVIGSLNNNIANLEKNLVVIKDKNIILEKNNEKLKEENNKLNNKVTKLMNDMNVQENSFNAQLYNVSSKLSDVDKEWQETTGNLKKYKNDKKNLIEEQEKYYNFIIKKMTEINDFLIQAQNEKNLNDLKISDNFEKFKISPGNYDIKYETIENLVSDIKKNILKFIYNITEKNNKYKIDYNILSKDKEIVDQKYSQIMQELKKYKQIKFDIENKNNEISNNCKELTDNYEKLKSLYTKLYNDFTGFTETNTKYVNDTQGFYINLINKIKSTIKDCNAINNLQGPINKILQESVLILVDSYEKLKNKNNELFKKCQFNNSNFIQKDDTAYEKIMEMSILLEESKKIIQEYEMENKKLKQEIEKINYRYNLLKTSIDEVEAQIPISNDYCE